MRQVRSRGVTAKVNLSLVAKPTFTALHGDDFALRGRILIAPDIDYVERAFDAAKYGKRSPHPWLEVAVPTVSDSTLAPEGQHILSVYVHYAPRVLSEGTWADQRDALYRSVIDTLTPHAPGIAGLVLERQVITPEDLEQQWGYSGGHIFHGEGTLDQWWISRPALGSSQYRTPIGRLYFASAGTHPGGGLTGSPDSMPRWS
jgi:phytoene dehydrogenase-like protein